MIHNHSPVFMIFFMTTNVETDIHNYGAVSKHGIMHRGTIYPYFRMCSHYGAIPEMPGATEVIFQETHLFYYMRMYGQKSAFRLEDLFTYFQDAVCSIVFLDCLKDHNNATILPHHLNINIIG